MKCYCLVTCTFYFFPEIPKFRYWVPYCLDSSFLNVLNSLISYSLSYFLLLTRLFLLSCCYNNAYKWSGLSVLTVTLFLNTFSCIVEKNPKKFKIDTAEVAERRQFVERAKAFVKVRHFFSCRDLTKKIESTLCHLNFRRMRLKLRLKVYCLALSRALSVEQCLYAGYKRYCCKSSSQTAECKRRRQRTTGWTPVLLKQHVT